MNGNDDPISHPKHYTFAAGHEVIDVIEAWGLGFHLGCVVKYIARIGRKGDDVENLQKARWYIEREIGNRLNKRDEHQQGREPVNVVE